MQFFDLWLGMKLAPYSTGANPPSPSSYTGLDSLAENFSLVLHEPQGYFQSGGSNAQKLVASVEGGLNATAKLGFPEPVSTSWWQGILNLANSLIHDFIDLVVSAWEAICNIAGGAVDFVLGLWDNIVGATLGAAIEAVKSVSNTIINYAVRILTSMIKSYESTSDYNYQKSFNTINYYIDNYDISAIAELPQTLSNYVMENNNYVSSLNAILGPIDTLNEAIPIDFSMLEPFQQIIDIINFIISPYAIIQLISTTIMNAVLETLFDTLFNELSLDSLINFNANEFNNQNTIDISNFNLQSNSLSISSFSASIATNNINPFNLLNSELMTVPYSKIQSSTPAKHAISESIAKPLSAMLKIMGGSEPTNTNPVQTDSDVSNSPWNKFMMGILNFLLSWSIDGIDKGLKKWFTGSSDEVFIPIGIPLGLHFSEPITPGIFAITQTVFGIIAYLNAAWATSTFGENYNYLHDGALAQLLFTAADVFGIVIVVLGSSKDYMEKIVSLLTAIASFIVIITNLFGISWPDGIYTHSFSISDKQPFFFIYQADHNSSLWIFGDLMNVLKMGLIFLDNLFKFIGKKLGDYLKLPWIGAMDDKNIFIIDSLCDILMSLSFVLF